MGKYDSRIFAAGKLGGVSGTAATLPAGAELGEERWHAGVKYKLFYNAGTASITVGHAASPIPIAGGSTPFSVTVSTLTNVGNAFGACVVPNATVATGYYFWGAVKGALTASLMQSGATLATGDVIGIGEDGKLNGLTPASAQVSGNGAIGWVVAGPTAGTTAVAATVTVMLTAD